MIVVRISGGIGNQLFQYALARSLKERTSSLVMIDIAYLKTAQSDVTPRVYGLNHFNISLSEASDQDIKLLGVPRPEDRLFLHRLKKRLIRSRDSFVAKERQWYVEGEYANKFDESILSIKDNCYLAGNWATPKYFSDIRDVLLKEISLKNNLSVKAEEVFAKIKNSISVSVHLRRGDYLSTNKIGVCPLSFYEQALDMVKRKIINCHFFVFSDEIEYAKNNLDFGDKVTFVSDMGIPDYEEIILQSLCQHNIMANSSFSWWGAWLNQNPDKIVIAPEKMRVDGLDTSDYIPEDLGWIRL